MGVWAEIKHALNSTLGTSNFESLDKILKKGLSDISQAVSIKSYNATWEFKSGAGQSKQKTYKTPILADNAQIIIIPITQVLPTTVDSISYTVVDNTDGSKTITCKYEGNLTNFSNTATILVIGG